MLDIVHCLSILGFYDSCLQPTPEMLCTSNTAKTTDKVQHNMRTAEPSFNVFLHLTSNFNKPVNNIDVIYLHLKVFSLQWVHIHYSKNNSYMGDSLHTFSELFPQKF
jgi:hypothetical protein